MEQIRYFLEEIKLLLSDAKKRGFRGVDSDCFDATEKGHGRVEVRNYCSLDAPKLPSIQEWVQSTKELYYISRCEIDAHLFAKAGRNHWQVENLLQCHLPWL